jgi:pimeloyl-ACP methyl ester carboxylesterase
VLCVTASDKAVHLSTGVTLRYVEQGRRSGVPVLLLHAYADSWRSFELLLSHLPESVHAFAPSQRGHGDSDRPADGYRPDDLVADVGAFMDAVGLQAAVLVGSSSAGDVARRFAIAHPERTLGVVIVGGFHTFPADSPAVLDMRGEIAALTDPVDPSFAREFTESTAGDGVPPAFLGAMVDESRKLPSHVWSKMLDGLLETPPATGTVHAPALVIWGDRDSVCPRSEQDALVAAMPSAELRVHAGAGHLVHWERPAEVAEEVATLALQQGADQPA